MPDQLVVGGLNQKKRVAQVRQDLAAQLLADQVVVLEDAAVRFQPLAGGQPQNEILVVPPNQLNDVACVGYGHRSRIIPDGPGCSIHGLWYTTRHCAPRRLAWPMVRWSSASRTSPK